MATIEVHGKTYEFPVGDDIRRGKIYYLKKALLGDEVARDMFLEGKEEMWIFIGKEFPLWLKVTKSDVQVIKPS